MKKVMFLIVGLLFAGSASAASLNLSQFEQDVSSTNVLNTSIGFDSVSAESFTKAESAGDFTIGHLITSNVDQSVKVTWTFNDPDNLVDGSGFIGLGNQLLDGNGVLLGSAILTAVTGAGYSFILSLTANTTYFLDMVGTASALPLTSTLTVSAVPIPAALFLFAPALLGFFGLRRKAAVAA